MRAKRLIDVVNDFHVRGVVQIAEPKQPFALADAFFGQRRGPVLFVKRVIYFLNQLGNNFVDLEVFVGRFFRWTGNDERRARFVNQDGVNFVDDGELVAALHAMRQVVLHVVAQIVEAVLVVRAVSDVGTVRCPALRVVEIVHNDADRHAEAAIERAHPFRVAAREVVVHGDDVDAAASE